jgi:hypothetical protein
MVGQQELTKILGADWDAIEEDNTGLVRCVLMDSRYGKYPIYGKYYIKSYRFCQRNEENVKCQKTYQVGCFQLKYKRTHYYRQ